MLDITGAVDYDVVKNVNMRWGHLSTGEGKNMAALALHIAAAYDAVNSNCTVALPVEEFQKRINVLARGFNVSRSFPSQACPRDESQRSETKAETVKRKPKE